VTATATVNPNPLAIATCNCVPSVLDRMQELSLVLLAFGVILAPIAWLKSGSSTPMAAQAYGPFPSGNTYTGPVLKSGEFLALGITLAVLGVAVTAGSYLVLKNFLLVGEGAAIVALGLFLAYRGGEPK